MGLGGVYYHFGKAGGVLKVLCNTHAKKDAAKQWLRTTNQLPAEAKKELLGEK